MSGWRDVARHLKEKEGARDDRDNRDKIAPTGPIVPKVPIVPGGLSLSRTLIRPAEWSEALASIDVCSAPAGIDPAWWDTLLADARWLATHHAEAAIAIGWSASDLFGFLPKDGPGAGGLADRLDGARRVALSDRVGRWRGDDVQGWLWRETLLPMPTIWEVAATVAMPRHG